MNIRIKLTAIIFSCILTSCHSYKPLVKDQKASPEMIRENVLVGKKYEIITTIGQKMFIKVDSIREDRMIGNSHVYVNGSPHREKNYTVYFSNVESIRYQKFSAGKTIAAIVIPIGFFVVLMSTVEYSMNFSGI